MLALMCSICAANGDLRKFQLHFISFSVLATHLKTVLQSMISNITLSSAAVSTFTEIWDIVFNADPPKTKAGKLTAEVDQTSTTDSKLTP